MRSARSRSGKTDVFGNVVRYCAVAIGLIVVLGFATASQAIDCSLSGFGSVTLVTDDVPAVTATITSAAPGMTSNGVPYCLVKVLVPQAIHVWVGLPMNDNWNGRLQSEGGGVYCGSVGVPASMASGYVGVTTDTGHQGAPPVPFLDGSFGMLSPGHPNIPLQQDFAYRSEHRMAVIGKQLINAFYGPSKLLYSYWNGCSTGGRQGLAMAQRYPADYDGILSGAPAIHFDRFQAAMDWMPMVSRLENGGAVPTAKLALATNAAVAACDSLDGVVDGILTDPRACTYDARKLVSKGCPSTDNSCLSDTEATVINKIWYGPTNEKGNKRLWYGEVRGTNLSALAGANPFPVAIQQPRYWVYFDPNWDWRTLNYSNYESFFNDTIIQMAPGGTATDNPDLAPLRNHGGKILLWHGFADQLIMPEGTIDYYDRVVNSLGGGYKHTQEFARLFMAPGVAHCGGGAAPQPQDLFGQLVTWVETGVAPQTILATQALSTGMTRSRPLCPYPDVAVWTGHGSTDDAANFVCKRGKDNYPHDKRQTTP
jgi:hypothetical protein